MAGNEIQKWADEFMFTSEKHNAAEGPKAHLLASSSDPLGQIAACAKMYKGEVVRDLAEVTDDERRTYLAEMQKTKLQMPMEAVSLHFMLENVTRAFTHQLVRQRTAAYAQESMRFAVVEDMTEAVALPPSLAKFNDAEESQAVWVALGQVGYDRLSDDQKALVKWQETVSKIGENYMDLVNMGMPAEDARGLMPTNIITRVNYITNLRGLLDHAGNRLCTQAQFEWRIVFAQIAQAMRDYGKTATYRNPSYSWAVSSAWQWNAIADLLRPVCYQRGSCAFKADFDRKCSIRDRVELNAEESVPSSEWGEDHYSSRPHFDGGSVLIPAIHTREWLLDPSAAR